MAKITRDIFVNSEIFFAYSVISTDHSEFVENTDESDGEYSQLGFQRLILFLNGSFECLHSGNAYSMSLCILSESAPLYAWQHVAECASGCYAP